MMKSYRSHAFINGLKFSCANAIKKNKGKIVVSIILVLIAIFTGVFIAIKSNNCFQLGRLQEINLSNFYSGFVASSSAFLSRTLSLTVNVLILVVLSFSPYLFIVAEVMFVYRGYLFGLNFALIFIFYGIGSMVTAIIVVLPCQLFIILILIMFYIILSKMNSNCRKFGGAESNRLLFIILIFVLLMLINLIETILLCLLNGKVILVI